MLPLPLGRLALALAVTDLTVSFAKLKELNGHKMTGGEPSAILGTYTDPDYTSSCSRNSRFYSE